MIFSRPIVQPVCTVGKLIDTVKGFAAACNWLFSCIWNLQVGGGVRLTNLDTGKPKLDLDLNIESENTNIDFTEEDDDWGRRTYYLEVYYQ